MTLLHNISRTLQRRRNSTWHAMGYDTLVRVETPADYPRVADLTCNAFDSNAEVILIERLRQTCDGYLSLVAEQRGQIVGHIMFSPLTLDKHSDIKLMALAPMAVSDVLQHQGIGSALVRSGLERCRKHGISAVIVLGHPAYYPRFGFIPASRFNITSPWPAPDNAFMLLELIPGALEGVKGQVHYHNAFDTL